LAVTHQSIEGKRRERHTEVEKFLAVLSPNSLAAAGVRNLALVSEGGKGCYVNLGALLLQRFPHQDHYFPRDILMLNVETQPTAAEPPLPDQVPAYQVLLFKAHAK
jgi:hypothetical protein